ncbi:hypothetical protein NST17_06735 [Caldifermentibacillus hisashii]|jgi:hypothetical protein|uniref:Uncharacterized protein n=1 Tax=Caldifermentibacillus hisashii TaxID=996558 RepID=A0ABU9JVL2_9BACI
MKKQKFKVRHFRLIDGKKVEFNPYENEQLADKCKLALAFMITGKEHVLVNNR